MPSALPSSLSRPTRRQFIAAAGATAAATGFTTGVLPGGTRLAFGEPNNAATGDVVVQVFLDGGADGLSLVPPVFDATLNADYQALRNDGVFDIAIDPADAIQLYGSPLGLHPAMAPLTQAVTDTNLAVVHAVGSPASLTATRSHFEAQEVWQRCGLPAAVPTGWMGRHLQTSGDSGGALPGVSASSALHVAMRGSSAAVAINSINGFDVFGYSDTSAAESSLMTMYNSASGNFAATGSRALNAVSVVSAIDTNDPALQPQNGAVYPNGGFARDLREVAQLIRANVGLQAVTARTGGWDTHDDHGLATAGNRMYDRISGLAAALGAFYQDLGADIAEVTIVVLSEFGRTIDVNGNGGTDHGRGSVMFAIGGGINGGVYGDLPTEIVDGPEGDLIVLNDFRQVLSEIVMQRLGNAANMGAIFPNFTPLATPLGIAAPS